MSSRVDGFIQVNMNKLVTKLLQGSVITQAVLDGLIIISFSFQLPTEYRPMCQKLWKLFDSNNNDDDDNNNNDNNI